MRTAVEAQRRRGDDEHATTTTRRQRPRPHFCHRNVATEPRRCGDTTTRRRRGGDDDSLAAAAAQVTVAAAPTLTVAAVPGPHRSFRRRYSPSLAAAPSLQMPSQSLQPPFLTGLTAPLTQEDGWWRGRRRDDDDATTSTGKTLISKAHSSVPNLGMGAQTAHH